MAEFVIKLADERGRVQEQVQTAASAEELRLRFAHAGYHVFEVKARSTVSVLGRRKVKLERFLIFNQQFLTLIRAGLPILGSLNMLAKGQKDAHFAGQLDDVAESGEDGRVACRRRLRRRRGFQRFIRRRCWPASAAAICRKCWSAMSRFSACR